MNIPFTVEQFLGVFEAYNLATWPMPVVAYLLGIAAIWLAFRPIRHSDRLISGILAFLWLWTGVVYHGLFFREINPAAIGFALLFVLQAGLLTYVGVVRPRLHFGLQSSVYDVVGGLFVLYAMVLYPMIGTALGHGYPRGPVFGLTPCPLTIFTFGLLLWTVARVPKIVVIVPLLWSVIGVFAALQFGIREDVGLLIAGLLGTALLVWRDVHPMPTRVGHGAT
jgi:hypothetical protein